MAKSWQKQKLGFTLVELSIVLVIIGLLIGGILVAQSMIGTVKIQRLIRDIQQYEIAINNFKENYDVYPGDSADFTPPGNANGTVESGSLSGTGCGQAPYNDIEIYQLFAHLAEAQMISTNYVPWESTACGGTMNNSNPPAGVVLPYTEVKSAYNGKQDISPYQAVGGNLCLEMMLEPNYVVPMETKMGVSSDSNDAVGLTNPYGAGQCISNGVPIPGYVSCNSANARSGYLKYYLAPF